MYYQKHHHLFRDSDYDFVNLQKGILKITEKNFDAFFEEKEEDIMITVRCV